MVYTEWHMTVIKYFMFIEGTEPGCCKISAKLQVVCKIKIYTEVAYDTK